jgi:hypothetical protein
MRRSEYSFADASIDMVMVTIRAFRTYQTDEANVTKRGTSILIGLPFPVRADFARLTPARVKSSTPTTPPYSFFSSSFSCSSCQKTHIMSDEVYEGAIGIDLGAHFRKIILPHSAIANTHSQARPTLASPTTRAPMSRSVCARRSHVRYERILTITV